MEEAAEWGNHRGSSMPGTGERDRRLSPGVVLGWDHGRGFTNPTVRQSPRVCRRHGSMGRSIKEDLGWADREAGYVVRL